MQRTDITVDHHLVNYSGVPNGKKGELCDVNMSRYVHVGADRYMQMNARLLPIILLSTDN